MKDAASEFLKGSRLTEQEPSRPRRLPTLPEGCFATRNFFHCAAAPAAPRAVGRGEQNRHAAGVAERAAETPPGP